MLLTRKNKNAMAIIIFSKSTVTWWADRLARKDFQISLLESEDLPIMTIYFLLP
jgi:hypothetical protein